MVRQLIFKEIHINLLSLRLSFAFLILVPLVGISTYILCNDYAQRRKDYDTKVALHKEAAATERVTVDRVPQPLMVLIGGAAVTSANSAYLLYYDAPRLKGGYDHTPIYYVFLRTDYLFIIGIVMSLLALLFSYDAISGEREHGTLRLTLANAVPRDAVLLGKWIGGYLSLFFPSATALLFGILIVAWHPAVPLTMVDAAVLGLLFLIALLYLAIFFCIGIFISAISPTTDSAVVRCLLIWLLFVLIIPNGAPRLAQRFLPLPSLQEMARNYDRIVADTAESRHNDHVAASEKLSNTESVEREELEQIIRRVRHQIREIEHTHLTQQQYQLRKIANRYDNHLQSQIQMARILSSISPYAILVDVATTLANTNPESQAAFLKAAWRYNKDYFDSVYKNKEDIHFYYHVEDIPSFQVPIPSLAERLKQSLPKVGLLIFFGIFFFMGCYLMFLRCPI